MPSSRSQSRKPSDSEGARATTPLSSEENPFLSKGIPADETEAERAGRLKAEKVSHQIDVSISEAKKALEKRRKAIKILLLGMSLLFLQPKACQFMLCSVPLRLLCLWIRSVREWEGTFVNSSKCIG
jgi:hypothetical protein